MRSYCNLKPNFDFPILIHEVIENPTRAHTINKIVEMTLTFSFFYTANRPDFNLKRKLKNFT